MARDETVRSSPSHPQLGDIAEIASGVPGRSMERLAPGIDGVPVVSPTDLTSDNTIDHDSVRRVPSADAVKLDAFRLRVGDVLVVRQGSIGKVGLVSAAEAGWLCGSSCLRVRLRTANVSPEYLVAYLAHSPALRQTLPGTVPHLNASTLAQVSITLPSTEREREIVAALATLTDQIHTEQAIIDRLRALRPALLHELTRAEPRS